MMMRAEEAGTVPAVQTLMSSPISKCIQFAANDCGYGGTRREIITNWVHPYFSKQRLKPARRTIPTGDMQ